MIGELSFREAMDLAGRQHQLMEELLQMTERLETAIRERSTEDITRVLDLRQGILDQAVSLPGPGKPEIRSSWMQEPLWNRYLEILEATRSTLEQVRDLEERCMHLGESFKHDLGVQLGHIRLARKVKRQYTGEGPSASEPPRVFRNEA